MTVNRFPEKRLLKSFRKFYERMLNKAVISFEKGNFEESLRFVSATAFFAWLYHPGMFSEARLEKIILEIGEKLAVSSADALPLFRLPDKNSEAKHILHVATEFYDVGGHSQLLMNWVKNDPANNHSLILTNQSPASFSPLFNTLIHDSGGEIELLNKEDSLLKRAAILRATGRQFDFVVLHHHPHDTIPLVAFAAKQLPPVAVLNHADHAFWLGASVADLVIELRDFGAKLTADRRKAKHSLVLPIPIRVSEPQISRAEARLALGIGNEQVVLLSIGTEYKYLPSTTHNFTATARKILDLNPQAVLYLIGVRPNQNKFSSHERLHLLGKVLDPTIYRQAADIYLEGFPCGSFTSLLETAVWGVCPVLMYSPTRIYAFDIEKGLASCAENAVDEAEYVKQLGVLINDPKKRDEIADAVKDEITNYHYAAEWHEHLNRIYGFLEKAEHAPRLIEQTLPMANDTDLFLVSLKNNSLQFLKYPFWLDVCLQSDILKLLKITDIAAVFYESLKMGDTKSILDVIRWRHAIKASKK